MTAINIKDFRPAVPRRSPRLLAGNYATEALGLKLQSGALDPLKGPALVYTSTAASIASLFRHRSAAGVDRWFEWTTAGVNMARSPQASDAYERLYWTGDGEPRMGALASIAASAPYPTAAGLFVLGVYAPTTAATISGVSGGTAPTESRVYAHSFVTQYGEEGALSPVSTATTGNANGTWNLASLQAVPPNSGTVSAAASVAGVTTVTQDTTRGLRVGEKVTYAGVVGMTDLNGTHTIVSIPSSTTVTVALTTAQVYSAGADTWTRVAPHNTTNMTRRIYRSVGTNTDWHFVAEQAAAITTYADAIASANLGDGPTVQDDTAMPPADGFGLVELACGALAMLSGNQLVISEREKPHSWPTGNRYTFTGVGVALVASGDSVIVGTDNAPLIYNAAQPEAAGPPIRLAGPQVACLSKPGMVPVDGGALMPSHDGLWVLAPGNTRNLTRDLYTPAQWKDLMPSTFQGSFLNGEYIAMRTPADAAPQRVFMFDTARADGIIEVEDAFDLVYVNQYDGRLYVVEGNKAYLWDEDDTNRYLGAWTGPATPLGRPINMAVAQVHADYADIQPLDTSILTANAAQLAAIFSVTDPLFGGFGYPFLMAPLAGSSLLEQPEQTARTVVFTLLEDDTVRYSQAVSSSDPFRLPGGFRQEVATVRISASCKVYSVTVAQSMAELRRMSE